MPNDYEVAHGSDPENPDADVDRDGDGLTARDEMRLGTDPSSYSEGLGIELETTGEDVALSFATALGKFYRLEVTDGLQGEDAWRTLQDHIAGSGEVMELMDRDAARKTRRFYRLVPLP